MRTWSLVSSVVLTLLPLRAQEARAVAVAARMATAPVGSPQWFDLGFEVVEARLNVDVAAALVTARDLVAAAPAAGAPGLETTARAMVGLCLAIAEGPHAARAWFDEPNQLDAAAPALQARVWLARARYLCLQGNHADEVECALSALAAASAADDPAQHVRAVALAAHITPERGLAKLQAAIDAVDASGRGGEVDALRPLLRIEQRTHAVARGDVEAATRLNDELMAAARADGNRRLAALTQVNVANRLYEQRQRAEAEALYRGVEAEFVRLGDRRALFGVRHMLARLAMKRDQAAGAQAVAELGQFVDGRGLTGADRDLLRIRFELALEQKESGLAAELKRQLDRVGDEEEEVERRSQSVRMRVATAEAARTAAETQLRAAQLAAEQQARAADLATGTGIVIALALLAGMAWRSRRRLLVVNRQLAEQVQRVHDEQQMRQALEGRMREIERIEGLGRMAAGVAHDFNNLLTSILGSAELLRGPCAAGEVQALTRTIQSAGEQAARLCRHLQSYAGGQQQPLEPLDLAELIASTLPALRSAGKGGLAVTCSAPSVPVGVLGDRAELEQVLLNLVVNAHDAGARHVDITLEVVASAVDGTPAVRLGVADDGHGMTAEIRQRIFDPFFTTRFPGRGLGLAVVHGVVRRHAAHIAVDSEPDRGSRFAVDFPAVAAPLATVEIPRPTLPRLPAPRGQVALVVDDEAPVRDVLTRMLATLGQPVAAFGSGDAVLAALAEVPPQIAVVLFVDLTMPEMDGADVVRRVRATRPDAGIVLMSGHPAFYVEQAAREIRPDRVLAKPFTVEAVAAALAPSAASAVPL